VRTSFTAPRFAAILVLTLAIAACGGGSSAAPSSLTTTQPPDPTYTVSGVVIGQTRTGSAPVEGVLVRVAGQSGITDGNGYYSLSGVPASYGGVSAVKAGYAAAREVLTVSGDTRHDFQLGPVVAISTLSGVVSEVTPTGLFLLKAYCWKNPPARMSRRRRLFSRARRARLTFPRPRKPIREAFTAFLDCIPAKGTSSGRAKKASRTRFHSTPRTPRAVKM
jgi:hypothetical protein